MNIKPAPLVIATKRSRLSGPLSFVARATAILIILTSSFDIFLVVNAGGNYRFCQIVAPILMVLAALRAARGLKVPLLGAFPLFLWVVFQIGFVPVSGFLPKGIGYCLWLLLNIATVYSFVYVFADNWRAVATILRWYAWSFAAIAVWGIFQFCLPFVGLPSPMVEQWWIPDQLARVNGFSYEPSYFASYLLIGFVFSASLRRAGTELLSSKSLLAIYWLTLIGIILSSSRMGIVFAIIEILVSQLTPWVRFAKDLARLRIVTARLRILVPSFLTISVLSIVGFLAVRLLADDPATMLMLLSGTGISNSTAHSVVQRENSFADTMLVFEQHPLIGRGLGGVSYAIGELHGESPHSFEASKEFEGMNIFAEVLAASGVAGVIPFIFFLVAVIRKPLKLAKTVEPDLAVLLRSLVRSLLFGLAILQFNQNILRPYLWVHLAVLATCYAAARQSVNSGSEIRVWE